MRCVCGEEEEEEEEGGNGPNSEKFKYKRN